MEITQIIPLRNTKESLFSICLSSSHIHALRMVLDKAHKDDWGSEENNDIVNDLSGMFDSLASKLGDL